MKNLKLAKKYLYILIASLLVGSCSDDENNGAVLPPLESNIVEIASNNDNLENLFTAIEQAGLMSTLRDGGPFTVLAPSDAAFEAYLAENRYEGLTDIPADVLELLLLNHVIDGTLTSTDLVADVSGYVSTNADSPFDDVKLDIFFDTTGGVEFNGLSSVISGGADIMAVNGVIHIVDNVIDLPTVNDFLEADNSFENLRELINREDQPDFTPFFNAATGDDPASITLFAPSNDAISNLNEVPEGENLTSILIHHIIETDNIRSSEISDGQVSPPTLEGDTLTFSVSGNTISIQDGSGNTEINIILADLQAVNGVIHVINSVMIPDFDNGE